MKFPLIGPSVESVADEMSYQKSLNLEPIPVGVPDAKGSPSWVLVHSPGLLEVADIGGQRSRGLFIANQKTYQVIDNKVYSIVINLETLQATPTLVGTLQSTEGVVYSALNPTQLILVDGTTNGYVINIADDTFTTLTAADHFYGGTHIVYYSGYFVYNVIGTPLLRSSKLDDGLVWNDLDVASAESHPDGIVGLTITKGELWVLGSDNTEVWYNAGNPTGFPLSPRIGAGLSIGCVAPYSTAAANNLSIFLDNRGFIVQTQISPYVRNSAYTYELKPISTLELQAELSSYLRIDDAIAMTYLDRGRVMYQITFPTARKTKVYDINNDVWFEKSFFSTYYSTHVEHLAQFHAKQGSLDLVCGLSSGKLYVMDYRYYTDNGALIHRQRITAPLRNEGRSLSIGCIELRVSVGATTTGVGSDPQITLRCSGDGRHTWGNHMARSLGKIGDNAKHIVWGRLGAQREWVFELSIVEPIPITIMEGYINNTK